MCRDSVSVLLVALALCAPATLTAAGGPDQPPGARFRAGEIVVHGPPEAFGSRFEVVKYLPSATLTVLAVERGREWGEVQKLRAEGRRAGLNLEVEAFMSVNDPHYSPYQWNLPRVQGELAWDLTIGSGATVAVLDTGLRPGGPDGIDCVLPGIDVVNGDNDPWDGDRHGTHVTGTVAQSTDNGVRAAGLAHGACILPVKVLDDEGNGSFADIAEGIHWAVDNGAQVINMSLGTTAQDGVFSDPLVDPALDYAYASGVTVICAAGNNYSRDNVSYPAVHPTTIAVGATDFADAVTAYSNGGQGLDLVAPGGDMGVDLNGDGYADGVLQESLCGADWCSLFMQGTSMASPHVAAVAAMLYAYGAAANPDDVRAALTSTATDLQGPGWDADSGHGLLQAYDALLWGSGSCGDADGDGWCTSDGDCDDSDSSVNPGAVELCDDAIDNNCDGNVDEGCAPPPPGPPAAPSNLTASAQCTGKGKNKTCTAVDLAWTDNSSNEDDFVIERCRETGRKKNKVCDFAPLTTVPADTASFSDRPGSGGTFKYRLQARNGAGPSGYSNVASSKL